MIKSTKICFICGHGLKRALVGQDFLYRTTSKKYPIFRCSFCEVEQILPVPSQSEIDSFYAKNYYSYNMSGNDFFMNLREKVIEISYKRKNRKDAYYFFAKMLKGLFNGLPLRHMGKNMFLDVGCGNDYNIKILQKHGWKAYGFEIGKKRKSGTVYFERDISLLNLPGKKFDYIRIWHVLEHVHNPDKFLEKIKSLASPNCIIVLGLPNTNSFYAKMFGKYWYNRDIPRHLINYNVSNLTLLLKKHGLKVSKVSYFSLGGFIGSIQHVINGKLNLTLDFINNKYLVMLFFPLDYVVRKLHYADTMSFEVVREKSK